MSNKDINDYFSSIKLSANKKKSLKNMLKEKYPERLSEYNLIDSYSADKKKEMQQEKRIKTKNKIKKKKAIAENSRAGTNNLKRPKIAAIAAVAASVFIMIGAGFVFNVINNHTVTPRSANKSVNSSAQKVAAKMVSIIDETVKAYNSDMNVATTVAVNGSYTYEAEDYLTKGFDEYVLDYKHKDYTDVSYIISNPDLYNCGVTAQGMSLIIFSHLRNDDKDMFELLKSSSFTVDLSELSAKVYLPDGSYGYKKSDDINFSADGLAKSAVDNVKSMMDYVYAAGKKITPGTTSSDYQEHFNLACEIYNNNVSDITSPQELVTAYLDEYCTKDTLTANDVFLLTCTYWEWLSYSWDNSKNNVYNSCDITLELTSDGTASVSDDIGIKLELWYYPSGKDNDNAVYSCYPADSTDNHMFTATEKDVLPINFNNAGELDDNFPDAVEMYKLGDDKLLVVQDNTTSNRYINDSINTYTYSSCIYDITQNTISDPIGSQTSNVQLTENGFAFTGPLGSLRNIDCYDYSGNLVKQFDLSKINTGSDYETDHHIGITVSPDAQSLYITEGVYNYSSVGSVASMKTLVFKADSKYNCTLISEIEPQYYGSHCLEISPYGISDDGRYLYLLGTCFDTADSYITAGITDLTATDNNYSFDKIIAYDNYSVYGRKVYISTSDNKYYCFDPEKFTDKNIGFSNLEIYYTSYSDDSSLGIICINDDYIMITENDTSGDSDNEKINMYQTIYKLTNNKYCLFSKSSSLDQPFWYTKCLYTDEHIQSVFLEKNSSKGNEFESIKIIPQ